MSLTPSDLGPRLAAHERRLRLLLRHLAGRAIRARVEVDDLLQEVYLRALARRDTLPATDDDASLGRLLAQIARHTVIDFARALRAAKRRGGEERLARSDWSRAGHDPAARTPGPRTRAGVAEIEHAIEQAFAALPPDHRRVLALRQLEGLSAAAAARRLGRSETAVHSLYRRALQAWETNIRRAGFEPE